jgi:hypothetical protein
MEVARDDGAVIRFRGPGHADPLPHDLVHFVVESELRLENGFWGETARGRIFGPVTVVQKAANPKAHQPKPRKGGQEVERLATLAQRAWNGSAERDYGSLRQFLAATTTPAQRERTGITPAAIRRVCARLDSAAKKWQQVRQGERLVVEWP